MPRVGQHDLKVSVRPPGKLLVSFARIGQRGCDVTISTADDLIRDGLAADIFRSFDYVEHRRTGPGAKVELVAPLFDVVKCGEVAHG